MVKNLKQILLENKHSIPLLQDKEVVGEDLDFATFYHGDAKADSKVLFLASYRGAVCAVLKIMRDSKYNNLLQKETDGQELATKTLKSFLVPQVYFRLTVQGHLLIAEEYVSGEVVGKSGCQSVIKEIFQFQEELSQGKKIALSDVVSI